MVKFSSLEREHDLDKLKSTTFDLIVIGGGVTGCGIALDAASRGMKTALIEKKDFASGTSSKSTKLIHGGLRYLKQLEFDLVHESGRERAIVHRLAPHLVIPEKMLLPIMKGGTYGKWTASLGILIYDLMAGVKGEDRRKMLGKKKTLIKEPLLDESALKGSCLYAEYRTDDARLTIELIKRAVCYGAAALNYCEAKDFIYENEILSGVQCFDLQTNSFFEIKARQIVSAVGPWVDKLRNVDDSLNGKKLHLTKGVHLVFPQKILPLNHSIYFDVPDGRMVFAIPRGKVTYVGTTDTNYHGKLDKVLPTKADVQYILQAINYAFPKIQLKVSDIISSWAGLRPLIHEEGKSPSELSRKDEIFESPSGLISIAGGKLTGYRKMAKRVVNLVAKRLDGNFDKCKTKNIILTNPSLANTKAVRSYLQTLQEKVQSFGLKPYHAWYLTTTYGRQADLILEKLNEFKEKGEIGLARAEIWFGVHYEMVNSLEDYFVRRSGRLFFDIESIAIVREAILKDLQTYLNWNSERIAKEEKMLNDSLYYATNFFAKDADITVEMD